jgi:uncharacterized zinc-type alcohol dehydrogenase-like protein
MNTNARAYAAKSATSPLARFDIVRREPGPTDVDLDILFCGVCHSDLHTVRDEWEGTTYPCVPGHEIVGRVARVGARVAKVKPGDVAAVGCMVDSCRDCPQCRAGEEQHCLAKPTFTYGSDDKHLGGPTFGGYSTRIVVDEAFVLRVPAGLDLAAAAPLLCAGITTYSPLRRWGVGPGKTVGIVGLGGLGHMGVKFARAFGARTVLFTTSKRKIEDGLRLGAHEVVVSTDADAMAKRESTLDFVLDTVAADHDLAAYLGLLKVGGTMALVGAPEKPLPLKAFPLIMKRRSLAGSLIGGIAQTQEMLDFCAAHRIASDIEVIPIQKINEAYERLLERDVRYRFVIDMATLKSERT